MQSLREALERSFQDLRWEQQILIVVAVLTCLILIGFSTSAAIRNLTKRRGDTRVPVFSPIQVSWQDSEGNAHEVRGDCLDISTRGLRMELSGPIEPGTFIRFEVLTRNLRGEASVCHCTAVAGKYIIGVQFRRSSH